MSVTIGQPNIPLRALGRMQMFAVAHDSNVYTRWKTTMDRNASWSDWQSLDALNPESSLFIGYAADGRMQIFGVSQSVLSEWKITIDPRLI
jgi:hypothetical protein